MKQFLNFIDGNLTPPINGQFLDNFRPATGECYSQVASSGKEDLDKAVEAAQRAFPVWSKLTRKERGAHLKKLSQVILENLDALAEAEAIDQGKPISLAKTIDIPRSAKNFDFFADYLNEWQPENFNSSEYGNNQISYKPLGVVGLISPWNLPLYLLTWKLAPALAAGNTVIAKPSELTPATASLFAELIQKTNLPNGVINILHGTGTGIGSHLVEHPEVKAISFTGSTATGKIINRAAASQFKKVSLEMGGKNPNIIFADCDFDNALATTMRSSFTNQGEVCTCGSRIFIEKGIYSKFRDALVEKTKALKIGDPLNPETQQGALVSKDHQEKVLSYVELAKAEGGTILCGGTRLDSPDQCSQGYFVAPTLIEGLSPDARTNQEEIFGPVVTLTPFKSEEEVINWANSTSYGLAATIHSQDLKKAHRVANRIDSGVIWINNWMLRDLRTPFGGIKNSGMGREGGLYGLKFFSEVKNICFNTEEQ